MSGGWEAVRGLSLDLGMRGRVLELFFFGFHIGSRKFSRSRYIGGEERPCSQFGTNISSGTLAQGTW